MTSVMTTLDSLIEKVQAAKRTMARLNSKWALREVQGDFTIDDKIKYYFTKTFLIRSAISFENWKIGNKTYKRWINQAAFSYKEKINYLADKERSQ